MHDWVGGARLGLAEIAVLTASGDVNESLPKLGRTRILYMYFTWHCGVVYRLWLVHLASQSGRSRGIMVVGKEKGASEATRG